MKQLKKQVRNKLKGIECKDSRKKFIMRRTREGAFSFFGIPIKLQSVKKKLLRKIFLNEERPDI